MKIQNLAYIGIETNDLKAWETFGTKVLGLMISDSSDKESLKFRMDDRPYRIALHKGKKDTLKYVGFELHDREALEDAKTELKKNKVKFTLGRKDQANFREVEEFITLYDPMGIQIELFYGRSLDYQRFISPAGVSSFVTGEMGLGHIVLPATNLKANHDFYTNVLGFEDTDFMKFDMGEGEQAFTAGLHFLHCDNPRHHTVGLFESPHPNGLIHLMIEVPNIDEVGYALDRVNTHEVPLQSTLGRHTNDRMISFYMISPGGFAIEYGCEGWQVEWKDFTTTISHAPSIWGHKFQVPE